MYINYQRMDDVMVYKVAICDDDQIDAGCVAELLTDWAKKHTGDGHKTV